MQLNESVFLNKETFSALIESKVVSEGCNYMTAVIEFADDYNKQYEDLLPLFSPVLLQKIKQCAVENGLMRKESDTIEELM